MAELATLIEGPAVALAAILALAAFVVLWHRWAEHTRSCGEIQTRIEGKLDRVLERLDDGGERFDDHETRLRLLEERSRRRR